MEEAQVYQIGLWLYRKHIWPDQCERLLEKLEVISRQIRDFYRFLNMSDHLPLVVCPLRYPLVKSLRRISLKPKKTPCLVNPLASIAQPRELAGAIHCRS